jgi:hypothetical protein
MIVGGHRGDALWIDPETVAAVVTLAVTTVTPERCTVYLKNGVVFTVDLDSENTDLLLALEGYLTKGSC